MHSRYRHTAIIAFCLSALAGCGGGGSGSAPVPSGPGPVTTPGQSGISVTSSISRLDFVGFVGRSTPSRTVDFTLNGADAGTYYGAIVGDGQNFSSTFSYSGNSGRLRISALPKSPSQESYIASGNVTFKLCKDANCASVVWSQIMPYTVQVYAVPQSAIALQVLEGQDAPAATVNITPADTAGALVVTAWKNTWLSAVRNGDGSIKIAASAKNLAPGTYQGGVDVSFASSTSDRVSIPVALTVGRGIVMPAAQSFELRSDTPSSGISGSSVISFNNGVAPAWTATSDQPWLTLLSASGTGNGSVSYQVNPAKLADVPNWSTVSARILVRAQDMVETSFPVTVSKMLPELHAATPSVLAAGSAAEISVSGRGLSQLNLSGNVRIGTLKPSAVVAHGDDTLLLTVPALAAGDYEVSVLNAWGLSTRKAPFKVLAPAAVKYASIASSGQKYAFQFDAARNALFAVNSSDNKLLRWRLTGGTWQGDSLDVAQIGNMGFAPDMRTLYVTSGLTTLLAIDPDTLSVKATLPTPINPSISPPTPYSLGTGRGSNGLTFTDNGRIWFTGDQWTNFTYFDMATQKFGVLRDGERMVNYHSPNLFAPANGAYVIVAQYSITPTPKLALYSPGLDKASVLQLPVSDLSRFVISADGTTLLADKSTLVDAATKTILGTLPRAAPGIATTVVFSPDGKRLYRAVTKAVGLEVDHIDVIDVASRKVAGTIAITEQVTANCGNLNSPAPGCGNPGLIVSPLGNALFMGGRERVLVLPVPAALSQTAQQMRVMDAAQ
jgi:hypothetical protein